MLNIKHFLVRESMFKVISSPCFMRPLQMIRSSFRRPDDNGLAEGYNVAAKTLKGLSIIAKRVEGGEGLTSAYNHIIQSLIVEYA